MHAMGKLPGATLRIARTVAVKRGSESRGLAGRMVASLGWRSAQEKRVKFR